MKTQPAVHIIRNVDFDHFIHRVMWNRSNARVYAAVGGLSLIWQGANNTTFAAFRVNGGIRVYRAMKAVWPNNGWRNR